MAEQKLEYNYSYIGLSGATYRYKKKFLKMVENRHEYYMPNFAGMCDRGYKETQADHWVYVRYTDVNLMNRIIDVLNRRYGFKPTAHPCKPTDQTYNSDTALESLHFEKRDYEGQEVYPDLCDEE